MTVNAFKYIGPYCVAEFAFRAVRRRAEYIQPTRAIAFAQRVFTAASNSSGSGGLQRVRVTNDPNAPMSYITALRGPIEVVRRFEPPCPSWMSSVDRKATQPIP